MKLVSIIVPVYNGSKYLKKTIESLLNLEYSNIEIILIDDGSTDNSKDICLEYKEKDSRVVFHSQSNHGISYTRNQGLKLATGDYIGFMDQDDVIDKRIYSVLVPAIEKSDADVAVAGKTMQLIDNNDCVIKDVDFDPEDKLITNNDILFEIFNWNQKGSILQIWNCLYRKSIIDEYHISFNESLKKGQEDTLFNIEYAFRCKSIQLTHGIVYRYFRRANVSTSLKTNNIYIEDFKTILNVISIHTNRVLLPRKYRQIYQAYVLRLGISLFRQYQSDQNNIEQFDEIMNIIYENVGNLDIHLNTCQSFKLSLYLKMISILYKLGQKKMAIKLILIK